MNMKNKKHLCLAIGLIIFFIMSWVNTTINLASEEKNVLPEGFVYIDELVPDVILDVRYFSNDNFVGNRIDGYLAPRIILTIEASRALAAVAAELREHDLALKIFDGYRPQQAVNHFIRWAADVEDKKMKDKYYPEVNKKDLFRLGYIAKKSGHSRGSTVDLTLINVNTGKELDMGSGFDFFGEISHHNTNLISREQLKNRAILKATMEKYGFIPYSGEWWHYTLGSEPYPDTYYDFPVQ